MSDELQGLAAQAALIDGQEAATAPGAIMEAQEAAQAVTLADDNSQGMLMVLGMAVPMLGELYPSLKTIYTPEACERIAQATGPLLAKHGVNLREVGGAYKEEIGALFVCGPIAWATVKAVKADIAASADKPGDKPKTIAARAVPVPGDLAYRPPPGAGEVL